MITRKFLLRLLLAATLFSSHLLHAQSPASSNAMWQDVSDPQATSKLTTAQRSTAKREIVPSAYRTLSLDRPTMEALLKTAPSEAAKTVEKGLEIQLPLPEGGFGRFHAVKSPIMEPELAAKYPEIKTYVIQGIDDPAATGRIDLTYRGLRASVLSPNGRFFIDPYWSNNDSIVMSYYTRNFSNADKLARFKCGVIGSSYNPSSLQARAAVAQRPTGASLRTYRLALAADYEYSVAVTSTSTPTKAQVLAAMVTSINRVTAVYEREFAIRLSLVANTDSLIFITSASSPYTNSSASALLTQNQTQCDSKIGAAKYDIGHVFTTGGGGLAGLSVVCEAGQKAQGETGSPSPVGDAYDIDYVAHEMGHQFGANHTFNGLASAVGDGNRNASTAYEPGSGSTIMAYAGICEPEDLQQHSDDYFHTGSYTEIDSYTTTSPGNGATSTNFPAAIATGNSVPVIGTLPSTVTNIPAQTPFALTASATDANGDSLTYCWEEYDVGAAQDPNAKVDNAASPIFRSYAPTTSPTRYFPSLKYILANANIPPTNYTTGGESCVTGEFLPTATRTMTFRVSVRDNRVNGGGQNFSSMQVRSNSTSGPFKINSPNTGTSLTAGVPFTVTWAVASTTAAPVSCANVKISYSTDGGNTFPIVLLASTANDGSEAVTIPNTSTNATTSGRIKVEAVGNIFFDIDDANLTVTATSAAPTVTNFTPTSGVQQTSVVITGTDFSAATAVRFNGVNAASFTLDSNTQITARVPATASTGPISVVNSIGTGISSGNFNFVPGPAAPTITSFAPTNGIAGDSVVITGADFSNLTAATFNGANASFTVNSTTQITAIVPSGATSGPLAITTSSGSATSSASYTVLSGNGAPFITSASNASGTINTAISSYQIAAGNLPVSFSASNLPAGLTVNASGLISGTPAVSGTILSTISATNSNGTASATLTFTIAAAGNSNITLTENFASITTGDNTTTSNSSTAWAGNTNFPTVSTAYQAGGAVRLGSGNNAGYIQSKTLDLSPNSGVYSIKFDVKGWTTVEGNIVVTVSGSTSTSQTASYAATRTGSFETKTLNFTGGSANSAVRIATSAKRAFIDNVSVFYAAGAASSLSLTGNGTGLAATSDSPGTPATLTLAGSGLTADIIINAPAGFEISKTSASSYATSLTFAQSGGTVASSSLYLRIATGQTVGNISGILSASSSTAVSQLALSGTISAPTGPSFGSTFPGASPTDDVGGVPALIAYALNGTTSGNNTAVLPQVSSVDSVVQITFLARTNDPKITIVVEGSTDLAAWTSPVTQLSGISQAGVPAGFERQTWSLSATGKGFLRVKVQQIN